MAIAQEFITLPLNELRATAHRMKDEGYRFIQTHAVYNEPDVDLYYSFMKDGKITNWRIEGVTKEDPVPSITDIFLAAFVFENEARELFGVDMRDIAIDFQGALYAPAEREPMRVITPEQKAAIEKARKAAAAKAAKESGSEANVEAVTSSDAPTGKKFVMTPEKRARFEAKLEGRTPEQIEKARACLAAKEAAASAPVASEPITPAEKPAPAATDPVEASAVEVSQEKDADLEAKLKMMDSEKAAKVRAALERRGAPISAAPEADVAEVAHTADADLEAKLALMEADKAAKVREALSRHASMKGGE